MSSRRTTYNINIELNKAILHFGNFIISSPLPGTCCGAHHAVYTSIIADQLHKLMAFEFPNMDGWNVAFGQCFMSQGQNTVFCEAR